MKKTGSFLFSLAFLIAGCSHFSFLKKEETLVEIKKEEIEEEKIEIELDPYKTYTRPNTATVKKYCTKIQNTFDKYNWGKAHCNDYTWHHVRSSKEGNPIIWFTFGDEKRHKKEKLNATVILCGVHGDEITPVKFCFDVLEDLKNNPALLKDSLVVVAPIVTPDSFFTPRPSRVNANGVDVNRNFPTNDWNQRALMLWRGRYGKDPRRFPGDKSLSEQETLFQVNLVKRYKPNKIISVHAPLTLLDYDGPGKTDPHGQKARQLLIQMSEKANQYKVSDYPFFPGSLGNWAGNELGIPTYTLELPNSDWTKTTRYFNMFKEAMRHAVQSDLRLEAQDI